MRILFVCIIAVLNLNAFAQDDGVAAKIRAAMAGEVRTEADVARDRNRKPVETLQFFQLSDHAGS
jgi:predicted methyltransferase